MSRRSRHGRRKRRHVEGPVTLPRFLPAMPGLVAKTGPRHAIDSTDQAMRAQWAKVWEED